MTLHILANPHSPVHNLSRVDAFSGIVHKFIKNMTQLGWPCVLYSVLGSEVDCENVLCLADLNIDSHSRILQYNQNAGREIALRKKPGDVILCFYGLENKIAAEQNKDLKIIEPSIGYDVSAVFADYRVFVSYSQMHMFYGDRKMLMTPSWFDDVIYNAISADEFDYCENKDDYLLFFGRVIDTKGVNVAIQAATAAGKQLIIAGPGSLKDLGYASTPSNVELVGVCDIEQRRRLMSKASAIIGPTYYVEPFGNMIPEGYMSGTPAITTDWGGFTETVVQGITGFRCREFKEFVQAIEQIDTIDPKACRSWAMNNCEETVVHKKFDHYIKRVSEFNFYRS